MSEAPRDRFKLEFDPEKVEETFKEIRQRVGGSITAGRYTKVRISFRGKPVGPDIPLALFLAGEGAAFWLTGGLAALLMNLGAKAVLDVEFFHEADELVQQGLGLYLDGETEGAEKCYRKALDRRPDDASALYNLGTLLRVTGRRDEALEVLRKATMGPDGHADVERAAEALQRMTEPKKRL
jgi:tetratricopeptide (TPR) repeat protein